MGEFSFIFRLVRESANSVIMGELVSTVPVHCKSLSIDIVGKIYVYIIPSINSHVK